MTASHKLQWMACTVLVIASTLGVMHVQDVHAVHASYPFDDYEQVICYDEPELNQITLDGATNQISKIRDEINKTIRMFSTNTNMHISTYTCDPKIDKVNHNEPPINQIQALDAMNTHLDGYVESNPEHGTPRHKYIFFNTHMNHPYSSTNDCHFRTQDPNLHYIANHEFGHFAGLNHIPQKDDFRNDFMSRDCNRAYANLPQKYVREINSFYPVIPS